MFQLQVDAIAISKGVNIKITHPKVDNLTYNFKQIILIEKQKFSQPCEIIYKKEMHYPEKNMNITPIQGNQIVKITTTCLTNGQQYKKILFTFIPKEEESQISQNQSVKHSSQYVKTQRTSSSKAKTGQDKKKIDSALSNSENFMRLVGKSVGITDGKVNKYILQSRKCRNTNEFINHRKDFQMNNHQKILEKQQMLLKGKIMMKQIYEEREGMRFFKNNWFMGPFYSYDKNEEEIIKK